MSDRFDERKMRRGVKLLLEGMGVDPKSPHFRDTPRRVARMYRELLSPPENNETTFESTFKEMVILRGHVVHAICPHHLLPFELRCYVAYIPNRRVLGLSKLARAVEAQLVAPILQEELGDAVADRLERTLDAKGVGVILVGQHGCMRHRGVKSQGDVVTSAVRGVFLTTPAARDEFHRLALGAAL